MVVEFIQLKVHVPSFLEAKQVKESYKEHAYMYTFSLILYHYSYIDVNFHFFPLRGPFMSLTITFFLAKILSSEWKVADVFLARPHKYSVALVSSVFESKNEKKKMCNQPDTAIGRCRFTTRKRDVAWPPRSALQCWFTRRSTVGRTEQS